MTSTGNEIWNDAESIAGREPTEKNMRIIFPSEAKRLWGDSASRMVGTSFLCNDPPQFLDHYYQYVFSGPLCLADMAALLPSFSLASGVHTLPST